MSEWPFKDSPLLLYWRMEGKFDPAKLKAGSLIVYGRMEGEFDPAKCPQAKLTSTTVCGGCGEGIKAGDSMLPSLAVPPAEGTWRHDGCPAPTPVPSPASYRGFGIGLAGITALPHRTEEGALAAWRCE